MDKTNEINKIENLSEGTKDSIARVLKIGKINSRLSLSTILIYPLFAILMGISIFCSGVVGYGNEIAFNAARIIPAAIGIASSVCFVYSILNIIWKIEENNTRKCIDAEFKNGSIVMFGARCYKTRADGLPIYCDDFKQIFVTSEASYSLCFNPFKNTDTVIEFPITKELYEKYHKDFLCKELEKGFLGRSVIIFDSNSELFKNEYQLTMN